jgi:hypothetical protein
MCPSLQSCRFNRHQIHGKGRILIYLSEDQRCRLPAHYVLVDFENIQPDSLAALKGGAFTVMIFVGASQARGRISFELSRSVQQLGANAEYVTIARSGPNAIDMHIAYYVGALLEKERNAAIHIISGDTDFDPLIEFLRAKGHSVQRTKSIADVVKRTTAPSADKAPNADKAPRAKTKTRARAPAAAAPAPQAAPDTLEPFIKQLRSMTGKPSTRQKLAQTAATYLRHRGGTPSDLAVEQIIDELIRRGFVSLNGMKVIYQLA